MSEPLAPGTVLHDRYTIEVAVQTGTQAVVYRATDALGAAGVVLIRESLDPSPEARTLFQQQAQAVAALEHPSLPVVIDAFVEPSGRQYLVTLSVDGPDLQQLLAGGTALREADVLSWFERILSAVEYLHARQPSVIHGAICPSSIRVPRDGIPRLLGLLDASRLLVADAEARPDGRDPYRAPEQYVGASDERSDIYGLAATLYALLTGKTPTTARDRVAGAPFPRPRQLNRRISSRVEAAILKAMATDPEERFGTVEQLWQGLQAPAVRVERAPRSMTPLLGVGLAVPIVAALAFWWLVLPNLGRAMPASASPTPKPTRPPVVVWSTAPPSRTPTPRPTRTATSAPTGAPTTMPLIVPTDEPLPRPTHSPSPASRVAAQPAPAATTTPRWFAPPTLVSPRQGAEAYGAVEFRWSGDYALADDEYFDLQVWRIGTEPAGIAWCKVPYYRASSLFAGSGDYRWRVLIIRGVDGQVEAVVSDPSKEWSFRWAQHRPPGDASN